MKTITRLAHLVLKLLHIPLRSANSEACEQFNSVLRRISSSTTYMQQSLFMRAITLFIADPNIFANKKKNKQQVQNADPLFSIYSV